MSKHKLVVYLNDGDFDLLKDHADSRKRDYAEDLVLVAVNRLRALADYAGKLAQKDATFRAYAPKGLPDDERTKIKALAAQEGIAPEPEKKKEGKKRGKNVKPRVRGVGSDVVRSRAGIRDPDTQPSLKEAIRGRPAQKKGSSGNRRIDLYDEPSVALAKARYIAESNGRAVKDVLKDNGRNPKGERYK